MQRSIKTQTLIYFMILVAVTIAMLWLVQEWFFSTQFNKLKSAELIRSLERYSANFDYENDDYDLFLNNLNSVSSNHGMMIYCFAFNGSIKTDNTKTDLKGRALKYFDGQFKMESLISPFSSLNQNDALSLSNPQLLSDIIYLSGVESGSSQATQSITEQQEIRYSFYKTYSDGFTFFIYMESLQLNNDISSAIYRLLLLIITVFAFLLSLAFSLLLSRLFSKPISKLSIQAQSMAEKNYQTPFAKGKIRELNELADGLNSVMQEFNKTEQLRRDFLANITHDFRTPLTLIRGYAELLRDLTPNINANQNSTQNSIQNINANSTQNSIQNINANSNANSTATNNLNVNLSPNISPNANINEDINNNLNVENANSLNNVNNSLNDNLNDNLNNLNNNPIKSPTVSPIVSKQKKNAQVIIDESIRLANLVDDIQRLSKIQAGTDTINKSAFDINQFLKSLIGQFAIVNIKYGCPIEYINKCEANTFVKADNEKIAIVMYNLITNAVNYANKENPHVSVVLSKYTQTIIKSNKPNKSSKSNENINPNVNINVNPNDDINANKKSKHRNRHSQIIQKHYALIEVMDNGKGIEKDELDSVWERFYRSSQKKRNTVGSGLGLSIVRSIFNLHNSNFGINSELNKGTTFWFMLDME